MAASAEAVLVCSLAAFRDGDGCGGDGAVDSGSGNVTGCHFMTGSRFGLDLSTTIHGHLQFLDEGRRFQLTEGLERG